MHTPVLNLDQLDASATPLKPPTLPSKSPFQSFQSKLGQSRSGGGVVKTPSPARPSPPPARRAAAPATHFDEPSAHTSTVPTQASLSTQASTSQSVVDLTEEKPSLASRATESSQPTITGPATADVVVMATPPPKPLARSLFSTAASVATKSLCFSTEAVASSLDVSPDGECIVAAFGDASVRLFEMDSTVPSDRHGYLLGHLDEESNHSSAGAHLRVKISSDGRYAFVGCRSGPRVMMSINLHNYRNGKDAEDEDIDQLQKSFHSNNRLRGFSDVAPCILPSASASMETTTTPRAYYLLCGLGVGTLYMWQFIEARRSSELPQWKHLYSIPANGNTAVIASFLPQEPRASLLQIAGRCEDKNVRVWNLEPATEAQQNDEEQGAMHHVVQGHYDVPSSKDVIAFYGRHAYGIAPTGDACCFLIPSQATQVVRTYFEMERFDMGSGSKSRRTTVILESIYASDDGKTVVAVSAEGIFYYTNQVPTQPPSEPCVLRIIGRNASLNTQFKSPMKVYKPATKTGALLDSVMAVITNPQSEDDGDDGYINIDPTETWADRWMKPSHGHDCWVCGVRNIRHWQTEAQPARKPMAPPPSSTSLSTAPRPLSTSASQPKMKHSSSSSASDSSPGSPARSARPKPVSSDGPFRPTKPTQTIRLAEDGGSGAKKPKAKPAPVKRLDVDDAVFAFGEDDAGTSKRLDARAEQQQVALELARYKERYNQIVAEWQRRLKGERQMRRLWKQRETEFESQLHETLVKLDAAEQEIVTLRDGQKDAEKKFIFEKLKAEQQSSVKVRYEQLCEQMQDKMTGLEHQQRLMEQTTRALLQEVDRHVHHAKQSVDGLVDRQQNECILCKDRPAVTAIVPCGHLCFCEEDAEGYRRNFRGGDHVTCPICQRELISMLRIF